MAVYRIYPSKDASIYSKNSTSNTGADSILEVGTTKDGDAIRALLDFDQEEIDSTITDIMGSTTSYSASLHMYASVADEIPTDMEIKVLPIAEAWVEGTGYFGDVPATTNGASWKYKSGTTAWDVSTHPSNYSGSKVGGGTWVNSIQSNYPSGTYVDTAVEVFVTSSYTHTHRGSVDLDVDVTPYVRATFHGELDNYGLLVRMTNNEFATGSVSNVKYFSSDTNTIYYPYLELKWDDSSTSSTLTELSTDVCDIVFKNIKEEYVDEGKVRFRLHARPKYPSKTYRTTSVYLDNYTLPTNAMWAIQDDATGEMVVDFDSFATKVSRDNTGSYFDVYMDILNVERYYKLLVKAEIDGNTVVVESDRIFKVVENG